MSVIRLESGDANSFMWGISVFAFGGFDVIDESVLPSGSFKLRGVARQVASLSPVDRRRTFVTFTSGSHGLAVAHVAAGSRPVIVMPTWSDVRKQRVISALGCELVIAGETASECEGIAQQMALERDGVLIHPYRSLSQIEGYTFLWRQIADRYPNGADVIVPVGSGGLLAGGLLQRAYRPDGLHIIAVESSSGAKLRENLAAGAEVRAAGQSISASALNVDVIPDVVRRILQGGDFSHTRVSDEEICAAEAELVRHGIAADAGAAAGFAAAMFLRLPRRHATLAVILTGRGGLEIRMSR